MLAWHEHSRYYRTLEKQRQIDEQEQQSLLSDQERFLLCALDNYIKCLQHHDKHDLRVFRLVSLWFDNAASGKVSKSMKVWRLCYSVFNFYARKQLCFQRVLAIAIPFVCLSVRPSVCHTGGSGKNGPS